MSWMVRIADFIFPFVEPLSTEQMEKEKASLAADVLAIEVATWHPDGERALEEAQRVPRQHL